MVHKLMIALCWEAVSELHRLSGWIVLQGGTTTQNSGFSLATLGITITKY